MLAVFLLGEYALEHQGCMGAANAEAVGHDAVQFHAVFRLKNEKGGRKKESEPNGTYLSFFLCIYR